MKTQCPHCKAKFTAGEKSVGKEAKCPKCSRPFIVESLEEAPVEAPAKITQPEKAADVICSSCKAIIGSQQRPYVYKANVVCRRCYDKMTGAEKELTAPDKPVEEKPESKNLSKTLYLYCWSAARIIAGILWVSGLVLAVKKGAASTLIATFAAGNVFLVCSVLIELALYYKMWAAVQDSSASLSPAKAVGLLFVPFFNIYWSLYMVVGFAEDYNAFVRRYSVRTKDLPLTLFLIYAFLFMLSSITVTIPMLCIFAFFRRISGAFIGYPLLSWLLFFFILAAGFAHFIVYIIFAEKTCNAINALPAASARKNMTKS